MNLTNTILASISKCLNEDGYTSEFCSTFRRGHYTCAASPCVALNKGKVCIRFSENKCHILIYIEMPDIEITTINLADVEFIEKIKRVIDENCHTARKSKIVGRISI